MATSVLILFDKLPFYYSASHPLTASVYLSYGILKTKENKLVEAKDMLTKSLAITERVFEKGHDKFADTFMWLGDLALKEKKRTTARDYYQKALEIYRNKFGEGHYEVELAKEKLKSLGGI